MGVVPMVGLQSGYIRRCDGEKAAMSVGLDLKGKVAVITGAAGGIGRAIAISLANRGCHLALADVD